MKVGTFTPNISRSKTSDEYFTNNVIVELYYDGISSDICQDKSVQKVVVKTFDYQVKPVFSEQGMVAHYLILMKRTKISCHIITLFL